MTGDFSILTANGPGWPQHSCERGVGLSFLGQRHRAFKRLFVHLYFFLDTLLNILYNMRHENGANG
jgi:hypothetical protein